MKMRAADWAKIRHFTQAEFTATGAKPEEVEFEALSMLDKFRELLGCGVYLHENGVTTGEHSSPGHAAGRAFDCYLKDKRNFRAVLGAAVKAGFTAIGVYWNGHAYSFHLEHDPDGIRLWTGKRNTKTGGWDYGQLLVDPAA